MHKFFIRSSYWKSDNCVCYPLLPFYRIHQDGPDAKPLGRGTRIELVLKEDMAEFLEERKVGKYFDK